MNTQRQVRDADRQSPIRKADASRQGAAGPDDRAASVGDVATFLREDCRALRDSLQLEMVVAQYYLHMRDSRTPEGVRVGDAISAGVVAELERNGDPLSHAVLRGIAHLGNGETAKASAHAVARLAGDGVELPPAFADVGEALPVGAWRDTAGGRDGEYALFAEFEHPRGSSHSLALFVEPRRGGVIKHIGLLNAISELDRDDPFHPSGLDDVEIADAGALLRDLIDRSFGRGLAGVDDYRVLLAAARASAMEHQDARV